MHLIKPICFIDIETTSADIATARIVEISILKQHPFFNQPLTEDRSVIKTRRLNPIVEISPEASKVHGITNEMVLNEPTFKEVSKDLLAFIDGCDIAGYASNKFDLPILYMEFHRSGITWDYSSLNFIDVCNIWKRKEERTLAAAYKVFCDKDLEGAHGAEADIKATAEIFFAQLDKYKFEGPEGNRFTMDELALWSNFDKPRLDITGKLSKDADGDVVFNFGKNKDKKAKSDLSYCQWILNGDFPPDVKQIIQEIVTAEKKVVQQKFNSAPPSGTPVNLFP